MDTPTVEDRLEELLGEAYKNRRKLDKLEILNEQGKMDRQEFHVLGEIEIIYDCNLQKFVEFMRSRHISTHYFFGENYVQCTIEAQNNSYRDMAFFNPKDTRFVERIGRQISFARALHQWAVDNGYIKDPDWEGLCSCKAESIARGITIDCNC